MLLMRSFLVFVALRLDERFGLLPHLRDWFSLQCGAELNLFWGGDGENNIMASEVSRAMRTFEAVFFFKYVRRTRLLPFHVRFA